MKTGQFESDHSIAGFFIEAGELTDGVLAGAGATYSSGNLFPVSHELFCIVAAEMRCGQRSDANGRANSHRTGAIIY